MKLAEQALTEVDSMTAAEAVGRFADDDLVFVDVRDVREVEQSDTIEGSRHAPRGMIEFWFDPESPYHRDVYADPDKTYVLFCNGDPRSALATKALQDLGVQASSRVLSAAEPLKTLRDICQNFPFAARTLSKLPVNCFSCSAV